MKVIIAISTLIMAATLSQAGELIFGKGAKLLAGGQPIDVSIGHLVPCAVDWNNDGRKDLISGDTRGKVWVFLNKGTDNAPELAEGTQVESAGKPITGMKNKYRRNSAGIIGIYSKLHFGDWDNDGLKDLLIGQDGPAEDDLLFYKNIGTLDKPAFDKPVPIKLPGHVSRPSPYIIDFDSDARKDLVCGTEGPDVIFYKNIGTPEKPQLAQGKPLALDGDGFKQAYRSRIELADWNNDGIIDLLVGNSYSSKDAHGGNIWLFIGKKLTAPERK